MTRDEIWELARNVLRTCVNVPLPELLRFIDATEAEARAMGLKTLSDDDRELVKREVSLRYEMNHPGRAAAEFAAERGVL